MRKGNDKMLYSHLCSHPRKSAHKIAWIADLREHCETVMTAPGWVDYVILVKPRGRKGRPARMARLSGRVDIAYPAGPSRRIKRKILDT